VSASTDTSGPTYPWTPEKLALFKLRSEQHKTDENFVFITGNGQKMGRTELKELTSTMAVINEFSDLTVNQSGGTAIVSGLIDQKISQKKNPSDVFKYKGVFTAVYAKQKKNWVLMSWQHSDYKPNN
jgi:hypothetical protein